MTNKAARTCGGVMCNGKLYLPDTLVFAPTCPRGILPADMGADVDFAFEGKVGE
jgi:hypothetical protein